MPGAGVQALKNSFAHLRVCILKMSDGDGDKAQRMFNRQTIWRGVDDDRQAFGPASEIGDDIRAHQWVGSSLEVKITTRAEACR
jgi:hypothetical protein